MLSLEFKELKESYNGFMNSQQEFVRAIEKARQSLMIVNSQATDVLPELKKCIKESDNLMQDFSFVLARANKKIDVLQDLSSISTEEKQAVKELQNQLLLLVIIKWHQCYGSRNTCGTRRG